MGIEGTGRVTVDSDRNTATVVYDASVTSIDFIKEKLTEEDFPPRSIEFLD
jgi:copper chaperone CopZ